MSPDLAPLDPAELQDTLEQNEAMVMEEFSSALIGWAERFNSGPVALYDRDKILGILMAQGASLEEAEEHFAFNIVGAWVGDQTPIFARLLSPPPHK